MVLVEVTLRALSLQVELFERAAHWAVRPRERLVAMGEAEEIFFRLYPYHYRALQVIRTAGQLGKSGMKNRDMLRQCESRLTTLVMEVIRDGIRAGDLTMPASMGPESVAFGLWSLAFGTRALMDTVVATTQLGIADGFEAARSFTHVLLDGLDWKPLSTEWDYEQTRQRVLRELFSSEWVRCQGYVATNGGAINGVSRRLSP